MAALIQFVMISLFSVPLNALYCLEMTVVVAGSLVENLARTEPSLPRPSDSFRTVRLTTHRRALRAFPHAAKRYVAM